MSVYVDDDMTMAGEKQHILTQCGKYSMKEVDLGERTFFLDHVFLGRTPTRMRSEQRYRGK